RRKTGKDLFRRTGGVHRIRPRPALASPARRGPARRLGQPQGGRQERPDQAAAAPARRLDGNPRRPRPAAGILPRLVGPDEGRPVMTASSKDAILARIRAANRAAGAGAAGAVGHAAADAGAAADAAYAALSRDYLRAHHD